MQKMMHSGETASITKSIEIIKTIVEMDDEARTGWKLKLAVAIALTFNQIVKQRQPSIRCISDLLEDGPIIDGLKRYKNFVEWAEAGELFDVFFELSTWQLRHVVNACVADEELIWARENANYIRQLEPNSIEDRFFERLVEYRKSRMGVSFIYLDEFYSTTWVTMKDIYERGGACGARAHFGTAMAQAFGLPALSLLQRYHVSNSWYKPGSGWVLNLPKKLRHKELADEVETFLHTALLQERNETDKLYKIAVIIRIMLPEWNLTKNLSDIGEFITVNLRDTFTIHRLPTMFKDLFGAGLFLDHVAASQLSSKIFEKYAHWKKEILEHKDYSYSKSTAILKLDNISYVTGVELAWESRKYEPKRVEISYCYSDEIAFTTDDLTIFPEIFVDTIMINFHYTKGEFDPFKMCKMVFKGVAFTKYMLLQDLVKQFFQDNDLAKRCLPRYIDWLAYHFN
jgi:hypothetical protein